MGLHTKPARNRLDTKRTSIMNDLKDLWAVFDWTHQGQLLGSIAQFTSEYEGPIMKYREKRATTRQKRL